MFAVMPVSPDGRRQGFDSPPDATNQIKIIIIMENQVTKRIICPRLTGRDAVVDIKRTDTVLEGPASILNDRPCSIEFKFNHEGTVIKVEIPFDDSTERDNYFEEIGLIQVKSILSSVFPKWFPAVKFPPEMTDQH